MSAGESQVEALTHDLAAVIREATEKERDRCAKIVCGWCATNTPMIANAEMLKTWGDCHQIADGVTVVCEARLITGRVGTANAKHFTVR